MPSNPRILCSSLGKLECPGDEDARLSGMLWGNMTLEALTLVAVARGFPAYTVYMYNNNVSIVPYNPGVFQGYKWNIQGTLMALKTLNIGCLYLAFGSTSLLFDNSPGGKPFMNS